MTAKKTAAPAAPAAKPTKPAAKATPVKNGKAEHEDKKVASKAPAAKAAPADAKGKPGRKPKADEKVVAKKAEESDVDLSDLEADLEGEPEAEIVDEGEAKAAKAKPLRMKVSRAKERA